MLGDESGIGTESADDRTIRLLNAEVSLLRKRAAQSDKCIRRVEALATLPRHGSLNEAIFSTKKSGVPALQGKPGINERTKLKAAAKASHERAMVMLHEVNHRVLKW